MSAHARAVVARQRRVRFSSTLNPQRPFGIDLVLWNRVRERAGLSGIRLHDLLRTYASQAVVKGIPLSVLARLLGHSEVRMTMRYAHVGDREIAAGAERIGRAIMQTLDGSVADAIPTGNVRRIRWHQPGGLFAITEIKSPKAGWLR